MDFAHAYQRRREKLAAFYARSKRMPSYAELMTLLGYRSKNAVRYFLDKLIEEGFIDRDERGRLLPGRLLALSGRGGTKLLGLVEAGFPSAAEEELLDVMDFDEYLVPNKESTYILKVKGDSMKDAGIMQGDMVIVERRATYKPGQIVIAMIDGDYTMKYLRKKDGKHFLEPANEKYKPIYPREAFRIEAVVTGVVRKY